jgi:hypothetical protein
MSGPRSSPHGTNQGGGLTPEACVKLYLQDVLSKPDLFDVFIQFMRSPTPPRYTSRSIVRILHKAKYPNLARGFVEYLRVRFSHEERP